MLGCTARDHHQMEAPRYKRPSTKRLAASTKCHLPNQPNPHKNQTKYHSFDTPYTTASPATTATAGQKTAEMARARQKSVLSLSASFRCG